MKTKISKKEKIAFSRRYSAEEWSQLCASMEFLVALEAGDLALCEVIASDLLQDA